MKHKIRFTINGDVKEIEIEPNKTLLKMLREDLDLTGTKEGCGAGECGACTVLVGNKPVNSCLTIEGLSDGTSLDPVQESFLKHNAIQCGYCTPGMVMSAKALLNRNPHPKEEDVKEALAGNLCRCTGYQRIVDAVLDTAKKRGKK